MFASKRTGDASGTHLWPVLLVGAFAVLSCGEPGSPPGGAEQAYDSGPGAAEEVARPPGSHVRQVRTDPTFSTGGTEASTLFDVQGAATLGSRVVVANGGDATLRYFEGSGIPLRRVGRRGGGPEEFGNIVWARRCSTDPPLLYVYDRSRLRMSVYDSIGTQVDAFPFVLPDNRAPYRIACDNDGHFVTTEWDFDPNAMGAFTLPTDVIYTTSGRTHRRIGTFTGPDRFRSGLSGRPQPFGADLHVALGRDRIYVGDARGDSILVFAVNGELSDTVMIAATDRQISDQDIDAYIESQLGDAVGDDRRNQRAWWHREMVFPERYPAFDELRVDALNQLWVRAYPRPDADSVTWWIFDPSGEQYAELVLPVDLEVFEIGFDHVLGLRTDALGIERVESYPLTRTGTGQR